MQKNTIGLFFFFILFYLRAFPQQEKISFDSGGAIINIETAVEMLSQYKSTVSWRPRFKKNMRSIWFKKKAIDSLFMITKCILNPSSTSDTPNNNLLDDSLGIRMYIASYKRRDNKKHRTTLILVVTKSVLVEHPEKDSLVLVEADLIVKGKQIKDNFPKKGITSTKKLTELQDNAEYILGFTLGENPINSPIMNQGNLCPKNCDGTIVLQEAYSTSELINIGATTTLIPSRKKNSEKVKEKKTSNKR